MQTPVVDDLAYILLALDQQVRNSKSDGMKTRAPTNAATSLAFQHIQHRHRATDDKVGAHFYLCGMIPIATSRPGQPSTALPPGPKATDDKVDIHF